MDQDVNSKLLRSNRRTLCIEVRGGVFIVRAPIWATGPQINEFLHRHRRWIQSRQKQLERLREAGDGVGKLTDGELRALAKKAMTVIPERVRYYAPKVGVSYGRITIRNQRTKWGICSAKGNLNFNCLLMLTPPEVIDSIVVHELCHRKEMNHSERFYAEVLRVFPDYRKWQRWLKENGPAIMAQMPVS